MAKCLVRNTTGRADTGVACLRETVPAVIGDLARRRGDEAHLKQGR